MTATSISRTKRDGKGAYMERTAMTKLIAWKDAPGRKPLVVNGARQVGKTWLVTEFGGQYFDSVAHVVFLENDQAKAIFSRSLDPKTVLMLIGALTGTNPLDGKTLVFLDEIQECPRAITALKLFAEQTPDIPVVAAGSLLGVALNRADGDSDGISASWPVGKVSFLDLYPMTFEEFLLAGGHGQLVKLLETGDPETPDTLSEQLKGLLREYLFIGGMPEVVREYTRTRSLVEARRIQMELLRGYELDFSKHVESALATERIRETWRSVPAQLANENNLKRFTYSSIRAGARGRDYRDAVSWLADAGLVIKVSKVSKPSIPLEGYADGTYFKLYLLDIGLLGAALHLDATVLLNGNRLFTEYKGAYAEQFVCQHLLATSGRSPYYWSADGKDEKGEVDFVIEQQGVVLPIEVKAEGNVAGGSIARFCKRFGLDRAVRLSLLGYKDQGWLVNVPLYSVARVLSEDKR